MKSESEFRAFYETALLPTLQELEVDRKKIVQGMRPFLFLFLIFLTGFVYYLISTQGRDVEPGDSQLEVLIGMICGAGMFLTLIGYGLVYYFGFRKKIRTLRGRFKKEIVSRMVKFVDESLQYFPEGGISQNEYNISKIFLSRVDRYASEDMISGTLGKTAIRFSEVHSQIKVETGSGKDRKTEWRDVFRGLFFVADFNKKFAGRTVVLTDIAENLFGSFGAMFQKMNTQRDALIKLEDPEFEKAFVVYGTDQVEARYILTPSLMQRIVAFRKKSGYINLSFIDSSVFIAIPVRDNLFEPRTFGTLLNFERIAKYNNYLVLTTGIVDDLNLNTRIWTKE